VENEMSVGKVYTQTALLQQYVKSPLFCVKLSLNQSAVCRNAVMKENQHTSQPAENLVCFPPTGKPT